MTPEQADALILAARLIADGVWFLLLLTNTRGRHD